MSRQATKAVGNRYYEARMRAAKYNEKLLTRAGAIDYLPGVTEDSLKKYELDITRPPNIVVALMAEMCNDSQKRQGISRVPGNRQYALVQIWYRMEKKAPARPQIVTAPRAKTAPSRSDSTGNRLPLPRHNDRICHFPAQPIISPLNRIKRFPAPVSAPQAYYDCCHSHM